MRGIREAGSGEGEGTRVKGGDMERSKDRKEEVKKRTELSKRREEKGKVL